MGGKQSIATVIALIPLLIPAASYAQEGVYWHIDPSVKTCSMVIDPSLTQTQWGKFTRQVGAIASFKQLASAEPLGRMNFTFGIDYSSTPVDQHDPAWINTFTHPDVNCPLGDRIKVPTIRAALGVSQKLDVGGAWTTAPGANYGLLAGELKYAILGESAGVPAVAASTSVTALTGVPDFNLSIYSVGLMASKRFSRLAPYLGVRESLAVGTETTAKVDLNTEKIPLTQGFIGATYYIWKLGLAAEYNIAEVNTFDLVIGYNRRAAMP